MALCRGKVPKETVAGRTHLNVVFVLSRLFVDGNDSSIAGIQKLHGQTAAGHITPAVGESTEGRIHLNAEILKELRLGGLITRASGVIADPDQKMIAVRRRGWDVRIG